MTAVKKLFRRWESFLVIFLILEFVVFGVANPKFVKAERGYESPIQDALNRGQIYEKRVKVA